MTQTPYAPHSEQAPSDKPDEDQRKDWIALVSCDGQGRMNYAYVGHIDHYARAMRIKYSLGSHE